MERGEADSSLRSEGTTMSRMSKNLKVDGYRATMSRKTKTRNVTPYSVIFCVQVLAAQDFGHTPTISNPRKLQKANILVEGCQKKLRGVTPEERSPWPDQSQRGLRERRNYASAAQHQAAYEL